MRERGAHAATLGFRRAGQQQQTRRPVICLLGRNLRLHTAFVRLPLTLVPNPPPYQTRFGHAEANLQKKIARNSMEKLQATMARRAYSASETLVLLGCAPAV
jgi:hypothetical protein